MSIETDEQRRARWAAEDAEHDRRAWWEGFVFGLLAGVVFMGGVGAAIAAWWPS